MEDTAIIGMVKQHQLELEQAEERTFDTGFLKTNFRQPMSPLFMPPYGPSSYQIKDRIFDVLTGTEIRILCTTNFMSPKPQIERYVEIIKKLLDGGIFDVIPQVTNPMSPWYPIPGFGTVPPATTVVEETTVEETITDESDKAEDNKIDPNKTAEFTKFGKVSD